MPVIPAPATTLRLTTLHAPHATKRTGSSNLNPSRSIAAPCSRGCADARTPQVFSPERRLRHGAVTRGIVGHLRIRVCSPASGLGLAGPSPRAIGLDAGSRRLPTGFLSDHAHHDLAPTPADGPCSEPRHRRTARTPMELDRFFSACYRALSPGRTTRRLQRQRPAPAATGSVAGKVRLRENLPPSSGRG